MAIRKFKVEVTRTDEYIIEIDDQVYDDTWAEEFGDVFHSIDGIEDIAKDLAYHQIRLGSDYRFIEGYGDVNRNGKLPYEIGDEKNPPKPASGLNIQIEYEEDYDYQVTEVTE